MKINKSYSYEIRVEGHLAETWSDWFDGLAICKIQDGETKLSGYLADQAALFGVLYKFQALNIVLISIQRKSHPSET